MLSRRWWTATAATVVVTAALLSPPGTGTAAPPAGPGAAPVTLAADETALIRFTLHDEATFRALVAQGADIAARSRSTTAVVADIVVSADQLTALRARGATAEQVIQTSADGARHFADSQ